MTGSAKEEMLRRIVAANGHADTESNGLAAAREAWVQIPRSYRSSARLGRAALRDLLVERLRDYEALVDRISADQVPSALMRAIDLHGRGKMLAAASFPQSLLPTEERITMDAEFSPSELDAFCGVITTATVAIAETGTLVLQSIPGQGRRAATLVPDLHICLLNAEDVVETVPEAIARLSETKHLPTTFISGPSATADIEMTRIKGVHGPRTLHVLLVEG